MAAKKAKIFLLGLILFAGLVWGAVFQLPASGGLHLIFCNVGQGDAMLATYRTTQVLIDGGPDNRVVECLSRNMPFWDRKIELVILTHSEADHFTGLIDVIERYDVKQFVINGIVKDTAGFWKFREAVLAEGAPVYSSKANDQFRLELMRFKVIWPEEKLGDRRVWQKEVHLGGVPSATSEVLGVAAYTGDVNESSIVLHLSFGDFDVLLTGDISSKIENLLSFEGNLPLDGQWEILKIAHHGSKYSSSAEFLAAVRPKLAVISVGRNPFGHPTKEVIERLSNLAIKYLRTDLDGEVKIVSDGYTWEVY